jgi:predicted Zn-dependent protease
LRAALFLFVLTLSAQTDDLSAKSHQAKELMAQGQFEQAVPLYEELCRALPANTGLRLNLGLALQMSGRHQAAIPQFERVLKAEPGNIPALISLGASRLETNDVAHAISPLEKAVTLQPANPNPRGLLANALLATGRPKDAAVHYRKLTALTPDDPKPWFGAGQAYELLAKQAFDELNKTAEGSPEWLALVGESRIAQRQYRSAFFFYRQALAKQPRLRGAHQSLADIYRATGHPDWAAAEDQHEAALPPPNCVRDKAECDFTAGRLLDATASKSPYWRSRAYNTLALQSFSRLGKLRESVELHAFKAEIFGNHGQYLEAVGEWRAALAMAAGDERLEQELAKSLYLARDFQNALPAVQKLLQHSPASPELQFFAGDSLLQLERPEEAIPYLAAAVKADDRLIPAHAALGLAYARVGRAAESIPHLEAALQTDDDGSLHYQLARAYQQAGNAPKAQELMAQYKDIQNRSEAEKRKLEQEAQITAPPL